MSTVQKSTKNLKSTKMTVFGCNSLPEGGRTPPASRAYRRPPRRSCRRCSCPPRRWAGGCLPRALRRERRGRGVLHKWLVSYFLYSEPNAIWRRELLHSTWRITTSRSSTSMPMPTVLLSVRGGTKDGGAELVEARSAQGQTKQDTHHDDPCLLLFRTSAFGASGPASAECGRPGKRKTRLRPSLHANTMLELARLWDSCK